MTSSLLFTFNFSADRIDDCTGTTSSVFNDKLLVSCFGKTHQLTILNLDGRRIVSVTINMDNNDALCDASWTPRGDIVYTTYFTYKLVLISLSGKVNITHTHMVSPRYFSIADDIIYLADSITGVYQSIDGGLSWSLVFNSTSGWHCWHVIKVAIDNREDFWTVEENPPEDVRHLRVYSVNRNLVNGKDIVTWRDIDTITTDGLRIQLYAHNSLSYDNNMNIFLSDWENKTVHVFSTNGQYRCQLLPSNNIRNNPYGLTIDRKHQILYVGQLNSIVGVFKLT